VANSHGLQFLWLGPCWPRFRRSHFKIRVLALFRESPLPSLASRSTKPPTWLGGARHPLRQVGISEKDDCGGRRQRRRRRRLRFSRLRQLGPVHRPSFHRSSVSSIDAACVHDLRIMGAQWIQKPSESATVMLGQGWAAPITVHSGLRLATSPLCGLSKASKTPRRLALRFLAEAPRMRMGRVTPAVPPFAGPAGFR
jgi:hypothetical protein